MKKLLRETKRGISGFLAILLILTSTLTCNVLEARANGNDPQLTVASDFSVTGNGSVYYLPTDGGNINDSGTWIQISGGISEAVDAIAIAFQPEDGWYASSIVFDDETFGDHDGSTFWIGEGTRNLKSVTFTQGEPPVRVPCQLTVASDFSVTGNGSVYYLPAEGGDMDDPETWVQISGGISEAVGVMAIVFQPADGWYASGIVFSNETFNDHDGSTFWLPTDTTRCLGSVTFSQGTPTDPDPQPCQLTVASYSNTYGKIYYTADLDGDENWVEVPTNGITSPVSAFRVKGVPTTGGYIASYTLNAETTYADNIVDNGEHGLLPEAGVNTLTNISFTNSGGGNNNNPQVIQIQVEPYTATYGKMQYSTDGTSWVDIPAGGLGTTEAGYVKAVPNTGYSASYRIDGNDVSDSNSHALSTSPSMHWIQDISFTSNLKSVTVASYTDTYGTIQYSTNGTDWDDVLADGDTVSAMCVRALAKPGAIVDSYKLNNVVVSTQDTQTLTRNTNNISDVSFLPAGEAGGKYTINITNTGGINAPTTIKLLDSSNAALATVSSGTEQEIPINTAKIRIEVAGHHELLQTMQIERKDKDAPSYEHGTELAGRIAMEASIINDGYAEFAASAGYSYVINITFSNAKNVRWRYPEDRNHGDTSEDEIVEHAKLYRLKATSDATVDVTDYYTEKDQFLTIGETYYFLLVPDYGYQVASLRINDGPTLAPIAGDSNMGVFKFVMTNSNFHFKGIVSPANDIIQKNSNAVSGATIADGANATSVGNVRMTVADTELDTSAASYAGAGATAVATVDIDLEQVVSKGGSNGYWSKPLTVTNGDVTVGLAVPASGLAAGQTYSVVRNHEGTRSKLNATYNSTTGILEFPSNQFSDYTIVKVPGTPATDSAPAAKEETKQESSESSSGNDDNDDSSSGSTAKAVASTLGSIVDKTATGGLASKTVIKDWNDLNNVLLKDNANNAAVRNNKKVLSDRQKAKGELVQVVLNKKDATILDSTFDSLYKSDKSGLHVFVANGTALTFINNRQLRNQKALDLTCNVTSANGSKIISFKTYAKLKAKTMLHTTVPAGVKSVTVYKYDAKGNRKYFGKLKPTAEGRVCFGVTELTKYELVYNY